MKKRCIVCGSELNLIVNEYACGVCGYSEDLSGNRLRDSFLDNPFADEAERVLGAVALGPLFGSASLPSISISDLRRPQFDPHIETDPVKLTEMLEKELELLMMESCSRGEKAGEQPGTEKKKKKQGPTRASVFPTLLSSSGVGCSSETHMKICPLYCKETHVCLSDGCAVCASPYAEFCDERDLAKRLAKGG